MASRIVFPETAFSVGKVKKPRQKVENHLRFIRSLPCCVCGTHARVEAAHLRMASAIHGKAEAGAGAKPDDCWTTPLCAGHHRELPDAQHVIGEPAFWAKHNIDPFLLALSLWRVSGREDEAESIIAETRARAGLPLTR